jgi:DNA-nicking Smr family endonuclease
MNWEHAALKNDEDEEFRRAVGEVKPVSKKTATFEPARLTPTTPVAPASGESPVEFGEELRYLRPGIQSKTLQKLRRGQFPIEGTLDLHGLTAEEANNRLRNFLQHSLAAGRSAVRIIHGKGYGSAGRQPVLKTKVNQWLQEAGAVLAFCSARPENGGTGAVDVLLRKNMRKP